jgi:predicted lipoprotein
MSDADRTFVRAVHAQWYMPGADEFTARAAGLTAAVRKLCEATPVAESAALDGARSQWRHTVDAWEHFSAVRGGALLARRSPREIDFMPTRPDSIARAIRSAPVDRKAMERIGSPAKGLPAMEWLLWVQPVAAGSPACRYAVRVAVEISAEGEALRAAYVTALQHGWDDQELEYALYEFLNLYDAGVQKLWWEDMNRPLQKAATGARNADAPRSASGMTMVSWQAHWRALRSLALGDRDASLISYLRIKGHPAVAAQIPALVARVDGAMTALERAPDEQTRQLALGEAVSALKAWQQFVESDLAEALQFIISFFDEDGD